MNFKIHDTLLHQAESPKGLLYRMIVGYTCLAALAIFTVALTHSNHGRINFYFVVNFFTVVILTWFIRKSFNILSRAMYVVNLRIGLFLLLNSTLISMAGGLSVLDSGTASIIAAILYAPAIVIITYSFKKFITFVNSSYRSAVSLALTDELTGLPNRRYLNLRLKELENECCTICIADIDHFKKINDTWGHEMGDKVLAAVGRKLINLSNENVFIARSGGEEFFIILTGNVNAPDLIRNICSFLEGGCNGGVNITLSVGVADKMAIEMTSSVSERADAALYQAKKAGRNRVVFN